MKPIPSLHRKLILKLTIIISLILLPILLVIYLFFLFPKLDSVIVANLGTRSFSIGWVTQRHSRGCFLAIPTKNLKKTVFTCDQQPNKITHLIHLKDLLPNTNYRLIPVNGPRINLRNPVIITTLPISDTPPANPLPAYGSVLDPNQQPVIGALVYIYPQSPDYQYPIAVKTNLQGNYAFDLGSLRGSFEFLQLDAISTGKKWASQVVSAEIHAPFPPIITITHEPTF